MFFFIKIGQCPATFSLFSSFQQLTVNMFIIKSCQWLDSNRGPLVSEATALPTEPQPHPTSEMFIKSHQFWLDECKEAGNGQIKKYPQRKNMMQTIISSSPCPAARLLYFCLSKSFGNFVSNFIARRSSWNVTLTIGATCSTQNLKLIFCRKIKQRDILIKILISKIEVIRWAIAQWIHLYLPSCSPGFESQAHHLCFIV